MLCGACASQLDTSATSASPVQWELTENAQKTYHYLVFERAALAGQKQKAINAIDALLALQPTPRIFIETGSFLLISKEGARARAVLRKGVEQYPHTLTITQLLAEAYLEQGEHDAAVELLTQYHLANPHNTEGQFELAKILVKSKQFTKANALIQTIPDAQRTPILRYYHARALMGLQQSKQAITELHKAVQETPGFLEAWAELAFAYETQKNLLEAERMYQRILALDEGNQDVWLRLVSINLKLNNPNKAYEIARQGPESFGFLLTVASMFLEEKFFTQAEGILDIIKDAPDAPEEVFFFLAVLAYEGQKDPKQAIKWLDKISITNSYHQRALGFKTHIAFYELDDPQLTIDAGRQGMLFYAGEKNFYGVVADALVAQHKLQEAAEVINAAILRWPNDDSFIYMQGAIFHEMNEEEKAFERMEATIRVNPNHPLALNYVGYTLADNNIDIPRALSLIKRAVALKPDDPYFLDSLAWAEFKAGNTAEAWKLIRNVVAKVTDSAILWEHYGDIAKAAGHPKLAHKAYTKALSLSPDNAKVLIKKRNAP